MKNFATEPTIQTILGFGMFTISLVGLVVHLLKNDKKK